MEGYSKFQYSQFDKLDGQYVVRTDDAEEFKDLVKKVHVAVGSQPQVTQTQKTVSNNSDDKPKVPYMWEGDTCPVCNVGFMTKTVKVNKAGEKYNALICDQPNCRGYAYVSKYPKPLATPSLNNSLNSASSVNEIQISNDDLPF